MFASLEKVGWSPAEWRESTGISNSTLYKLVREKKLSIVKVGRRTVITEHPRDFLQRMAMEAA